MNFQRTSGWASERTEEHKSENSFFIAAKKVKRSQTTLAYMKLIKNQ